MASTYRSDSLRLLAVYKQTGDPQAREQLAVNYMPLVRSLCRRFQPSREPQEDLFQIGMIGLLHAIEKFDMERGTSFSSLAIPGILGAILNYLRDHGSLIKLPRTVRRNKLTLDRASESLACSLGHWPTVSELSDACDLSEDEVHEAAKLGRIGDPRSLDEHLESSNSDEGVTLAEYLGQYDRELDLSLDRLVLATALDTLSSREKTILKLRFYKEMSQREVAERIDMSEMHVSRLERSALRKLRQVLQQGRDSGASKGEPVGAGTSLSAA